MQSEPEQTKKGNSNTVPKGKHPGTVKAQYWKVIAAREALGWSPRTLSERSCVSLTTIRSIESGKDAFPSSLEKIGKPLGLKLKDLIVSDHASNQSSSPVDVSPTTRPLQIVLNFASVTEFLEKMGKKTLLEILQDEARLQGTIELPELKNGSVIASLNIQEEDFWNLLSVFCKSGLTRSKIAEIDCPPNSILSNLMGNRRYGLHVFSLACSDIERITLFRSGHFDDDIERSIVCELTERIVPYSIDVYYLKRYDGSVKFIRAIPQQNQGSNVGATEHAPLVDPVLLSVY